MNAPAQTATREAPPAPAAWRLALPASRLAPLFVLSAGAILLVAALGRFLVAASNAQILAFPEPALGIPFRQAVLAVGALEVVVALICLLSKRAGLQLGSLIWLSLNFAGYRACLHFLQLNPEASCIGALTDPLHLARGVAGRITWLLPFYLLLGSLAASIWLWLEGRKTQSLKMPCPACGTHVQFATQNLGRKAPCPHCHASITLRRPELLKMSCFFCQGHIEFPAHAIGEKLKCPHCKQDITLQEPA
jgi:hypothetical protein